MVHLFKEGFTPLYKSNFSEEVLKQDLLDIKYSHCSSGPVGFCFSRSKHFLNDSNIFYDYRLIFNREKLRQRYKIFPVDEIYNNKKVSNLLKDRHTWGKKKYKDEKIVSLNKANFPFGFREGKLIRQPRHNHSTINFNETALEFEFEERILSSIPNLGRYIYAINYWDNTYSFYEKEVVINYLDKYPHIKILTGYDKFEDKTEEFKEKFGYNSKVQKILIT